MTGADINRPGGIDMNKPKIVVYTRHPENSSHAQSSIEQRSILKQFSGKYEIVPALKSGFSPVVRPLWYGLDKTKPWEQILSENWGVFKDRLNFDASDTDIHGFIFFGAPIPMGVFNNKSSTERVEHAGFIQSNSDLSLLLTYEPMVLYLSCLKAISDANRLDDAHYVLYDPEELHVPTPKRYFGYDWRAFKRLDTLQYHYETNSSLDTFFDDEIEKKYDLTFGLSVVTKGREEIYDKLIKAGIEPLAKFKKRNINTEVSRGIYLDRIQASKFTLVVPAINQDTFSIYRFVESLNANCLPLITSDCNTSDVERSFGVDLSPLIVDYEEIDHRMKTLDREEMLSRFREIFLKAEKTTLLD